MTEAEANLYIEAIRDGLVVFAPKSEKNLREQYPQLDKYEEFKELHSEEMMFLWFFRCSCSPFANYEDKDKLGPCIDIAWLSEQVRAQKKEEWKRPNLKGFTGKMPAAIARMASFNTSAMIRRYQSALILLNNSLEIVAQPISAMTDEQKDKYIVRAIKAQGAIDDITASLQGGDYAVEETANTILPSLMGRIKEFRLSQN
jgi:hypothetical protein